MLAVLLLAAASGAARAEGAAALGPEVGPSQATGGFVGTLALRPDHGAAGTTISVTAEGLPPAQDFDLVWRTVKGGWKAGQGEYHGRDYAAVGYRIARVKSDAAGRIEAGFVAPEDFGFEHDIQVQQGKRLLIQAGFTLDMTMTATPASGPPGTPIEIEIKGIGWRELENSWMLVYDTSFTGWASAVSTHGTAHVTIPATGAAGVHVLQLIHGEFTFPYLNPQQNPVPNRPRFKTRFEVTRGEAVLPPPPERQGLAEIRILPPPGALIAAPDFGGIGTAVTVSGAGFRPGQDYRLDWGTVTGNRVAGAGWEERAKPVAEAKAGSDGRIAFHFAVPDDLGGAHGFFVEGGDAKKQSGSFWLSTTALPLAAQRFPAGGTVTLHLKGVGWTETSNIYHLVYDNAYLGYACGFNSQGDVTIELPASGGPGWHFIDLYPGIYKGEEVRPNDFRIPQLTYAADHPGEDLPAFHFAIEVSDEAAARVGN